MSLSTVGHHIESAKEAVAARNGTAALAALDVAQEAYNERGLTDVGLLANILLVYGAGASVEGHSDDALALFSDAADLLADSGAGEDDVGLIAPLTNIGSVLRDEGNYAEALRILKRAYAISENVLGSDPEVRARVCWALAVTYDLMGQFGEAADYYAKGLSLVKPATLEDGDMLHNYGVTLLALDKFKEAFGAFRDARRVRDTLLGPEALPTLRSTYFMALVLCYVNRFEGAAGLVDRVVDGTTEDEELGALARNLGDVLSDVGV